VIRPLCVLFVTGLDRRRLSHHDSPNICRLFETCPSVAIHPLPSNELPSTLYSGVYPRRHGMWQVTLRRDVRDTATDRMLDRLPDIVTTTWQCFRHALDSSYDIPGVPRRRRRLFEVHRFKYTGRSDKEQKTIGGVPSIFSVLGDRCSYRFTKSFERLAAAAAEMPVRGKTLSIVEAYAFDLFTHWNLDRPEAMRTMLAEVDRQVERVERQCREQGARFMLMSDHGQEPVHHYIDLARALRASGVPAEDYAYYLEAAIARFWFRNERARAGITGILRSIQNTTLLTYRQLHEYDICFDDDRYGELFLYAHHGHVFHPNDFTHPLANLFMALSEPTMRHRMWNPRHRGYHGYLPGHPADDGFLVLADPEFRAAAERIELIDVAPTILALVGERAPDHMTGRAVFEPKRTVGSSAVRAV